MWVARHPDRLLRLGSRLDSKMQLPGLNNLRINSHSGRAEASRTMRYASVAFLIVLAALVVGLGIKSLFAVPTHAAMFSHPFQFDESEGMIVAETILLDRGVNIFAPVTPDLFIAAPYPPVFYLLLWPFQHLLGDEPSFKLGRAITLLATLLAGVSIAGITYALTRNRLAGALGTVTFWSLGLVTFWGSLVKPDMLALALGLAGLWWLLARPTSQVWWALPLFLLAFFTKQTAIAAAAAACSWLLITRWRVGVPFTVAYAAGAVVPSLLLDGATGGGYFYHMFTIHDLPWFPGRFVQYMSNFLLDYGVLLVPGMLAIVFVGLLCLYRRVRGTDSVLPRYGGLLLLGYLGMSVAVAAGTGTHGGNHNHLLELAAVSCLGLGVGAGMLMQAGAWQWKAVGAVTGLLLLAWVPSLFGVPVWLQLEFNQLKSERTEGMQSIFQYVTNNGGTAYSDNVGLLLLARKRLWSTDPFTQTHATYYGRWDESKLVQTINDRGFAQIVLREDVDSPDAGAGDVSPGILQAVRDKYTLDERNVLNIYVPK
jgi:hypothetical protein